MIECEDCGTKRVTRYKNTKYCEICRLLRNLKFIGDRTESCLVTKKRFAPIKRNQQLSLTCDPYSTPAGHEGTCGVCDTEGRLYGDNVKVCTECLDDPKQRGKIIAMLIQKQANIKSGRTVIPDPPMPVQVTGTEAQEDKEPTPGEVTI